MKMQNSRLHHSSVVRERSLLKPGFRVAGTLFLSLGLLLSANAGVVDDIKNLINALSNVVNLVKKTCSDASTELNNEVDVAVLNMANQTASDVGLTGDAAARADATRAEAERLQAAGTVVFDAAAMQVFRNAADQTRQLKQDVGASLGLVSGIAATIKRDSRQGLDSASQSTWADINDNIVTQLKDYLLGLRSHPWDFDLAYVQTQLAAIQAGLAAAPQRLADAQTQATRAAVAQLVTIMTEIQQKRAEAERLAAAAKDALDKALNRPRLSTTGVGVTEQVAPPDPVKVVGKVTSSHQAGWDALGEQLNTLASKAHVSAQQEKPAPTSGTTGPGASGAGTPPAGASSSGAQNPGAPATGAQGASGNVKVLFEPMPDFDVDQTEDVALDFYVFGELQGTPRIEGHRITTSYKLQYGKPMPGALGICRKFIENVRQAGGEILHDNNRNYVTARVTQGGRETWAEIACDKDRYRTNIVERDSGQQNTNVAKPAQPDHVIHKHINQPNYEDLRATGTGAQPATRGTPLSNGKTDRKTVTIISKAPASTKFSIVVDSGPGADLAVPAPCADKPTPARKLVGATKWSNIVLKRGFADQIRARKLNLVDNNTWSCHTQEGALVEGALVTDRPLP